MTVGEHIAKLIALKEKGLITDESKIFVPAQPDKNYDRTSETKFVKDGKRNLILCDVDDSVFGDLKEIK